jgi:hypothetical protein
MRCPRSLIVQGKSEHNDGDGRMAPGAVALQNVLAQALGPQHPELGVDLDLSRLPPDGERSIDAHEVDEHDLWEADGQAPLLDAE